MPIRDLAVFLLVFAAIPFMLQRPVIGVLYWAWLSLMNPHRLTWGPAYDFPFAQIVALVTFTGIFLTRDEIRFKARPELWLLLLLLSLMTFTTFFALNQKGAWDAWSRVMKIQLVTFLSVFVLRTKQHVDWMVWVVVLSIGFFGVKGGIYTIRTAGEGLVFGPGGFIGDNNALALALIMNIPLTFYLFHESKKGWIKWGLAASAVLSAFAILGTHSRGALLAITAMAGFLWIKSPRKVPLGLALAVVAPMLLLFMPQKWAERMGTILEYEHDFSAMGRINAWKTLVNMANDKPLTGAGFEPYTQDIFARYSPDPLDLHSAHSVWFQVLGEHGYIVFALFLLMWFLTWRNAAWIIRQAKQREELRWAALLASMVQVSYVGYFVGGTFLNLAYWDMPYFEMVMLVVVRDILNHAIGPAATADTGAVATGGSLQTVSGRVNSSP